jgi:hypothetical protein
MKPKPIPKELINKIELRVEDFEITPRERHGFKGYLLKDVLVPYIDNKRVGFISFFLKVRKNKENVCEIRYMVWAKSNYLFSRIAYIILNKDDPRVIETKDHFDIIDNLSVDHIKDVAVQNNKFIIKPDRENNLQLLTRAENNSKAVKRMSDLPKHIHFRPLLCAWCFEVKKSIKNTKNKVESFSILSHGWEGAYAKAIDACNKITGSNHIPDLNEAIPKEFKGMTEREAYEKYSYNFNGHRGWRQIHKRKNKPNNQLDLGLSLT